MKGEIFSVQKFWVLTESTHEAYDKSKQELSQKEEEKV